MSVKKHNYTTTFSHLGRTEVFAFTTTLYSRGKGWDGRFLVDNPPDDPKEYMFQKIGKDKAITLDRRTVVNILPTEKIIPCYIEKSSYHRA
jgi:hypothetical protein